MTSNTHPQKTINITNICECANFDCKNTEPHPVKESWVSATHPHNRELHR